ncbi:SDR family NAD(P)-dependent oxidoreductase [Streptomyces sp. S.PB5]|uniref:SDR family NAD(P)-dependent oxidoreductase n=1 Tax=Streptomyces sp. S.PB5 TaxID=3020844 RepID=UPI0025AF94F9|nr:SDR family NAD(P)-dependent oxidoreductase [Streptomyces sp. S.PB5]MDN3023272.1 SDR family NAD(P)-dependent oxidoreductase [Streptomyces sp. S.PB5]
MAGDRRRPHPRRVRQTARRPRLGRPRRPGRHRPRLDPRDRRPVAPVLAGHGLDAFVNNAGVIVQGPLELVPPHALRRQFEINVLGQAAVIQTFLPALRQAGGRVVNVGAVTARTAVPFFGPVAAPPTTAGPARPRPGRAT